MVMSLFLQMQFSVLYLKLSHLIATYQSHNLSFSWLTLCVKFILWVTVGYCLYRSSHLPLEGLLLPYIQNSLMQGSWYLNWESMHQNLRAWGHNSLYQLQCIY